VRSLIAAAAAALLAGCASGFMLAMPGVEFELSARLAVRYGKEATSGNLAWRHGLEDDELLLTSPFGQGVARIVRAKGTVVLTASDGREYRAADAEALTEKTLGFRLPLAGLADWVRGRPASAPAPTLVRRDAEGRLAELEQAGWRVEYVEYDGALPSRLKLGYPGLDLRLAISEWK